LVNRSPARIEHSYSSTRYCLTDESRLLLSEVALAGR
jgi:hypothetical protein